ncbi:BNR repeat-containing protein [Mucilaginibacter mali]|nr:BNR repeat-containing protein [Mucilaginibacter mali]
MLKKLIITLVFAIIICAVMPLCTHAQQAAKIIPIPTAGAWANNSVNTVIFRKNSLVTAGGYQYAAFYDNDQFVVLAKRKTGAEGWQINRTQYKGDATDAHKSISIMVDGAGFLHVVWGLHNNPVNYAKSQSPGSLTLGDKLSMTGDHEQKVSYPEFYKQANGDLLFFYRDGASGNGNLLVDTYHTKTQKWERLQDNLIDGEGQRSAYWQITVDVKGTIHISWVWRESPDVASNHDIAYACSKDGGKTWQKSTGEIYHLPITASNAEYACRIPQKSELINQTSMFADAQGQPFIATYWREQGQTVPQYHIVYKTGATWQVNNLSFRKGAFSLSGGGTKQIPISRPQIIAWPVKGQMAAALIFRDADLGDKVSIAVTADIKQGKWQVSNLTDASVGSWEPTYDTELWKQSRVLNLFVQKNVQVDGEGRANIPPQPVQVIEWKPTAIK